MGRLQGRRMLVTGAASGIGLAVARRFAAEGARVAVNDLPGPALEAALASLPPVPAPAGVAPHAAAPGDVSDEAAAAGLVEAAAAGLGGLDGLVNNAGIQLQAPFEAMVIADFDRVMAVNLRGAVLCARAMIRHLLAERRGGVVLNCSSVHEAVPKPGFLGYAASKAAMGAVTRTLALEFAGRGIRVNAVAPGATVTPMNAAWTGDPAGRAAVERHIPTGRAVEPHEIAACFVFLASDEAASITGQTIFVDGGLSLHPEFRESWAS